MLRVPRRVVLPVAVAGALVAGVVTGVSVMGDGEVGPARASSATAVFVPPCSDSSPECVEARLGALEAWAAKDNPVPSESPTPTPTETETPSPTPPETPTPTPTPTPTVEPTPTPTPTSTPTQPSSSVLWGMSAPDSQWAARAAEVGPGIDARRLFFTSFDAGLGKIGETCADGMYPLVSFKTGTYSWEQVGAGNADAALRSLAARLAGYCDLFVAVHHEPNGDGAAADFARMQARALPILGEPAGISVGPIMNGFIFYNYSGGRPMPDSQIAQWLPPSVLDVSDVIAADHYQGGTTAQPLVGAGPKIRAMSDWADRVGVDALGVGEFNGLSAQTITEACDAVTDDPRFQWASIFNSNENNRDGVSWQLTGDRLGAYQDCIR